MLTAVVTGAGDSKSRSSSPRATTQVVEALVSPKPRAEEVPESDLNPIAPEGEGARVGRRLVHRAGAAHALLCCTRAQEGDGCPLRADPRGPRAGRSGPRRRTGRGRRSTSRRSPRSRPRRNSGSRPPSDARGRAQPRDSPRSTPRSPPSASAAAAEAEAARAGGSWRCRSCRRRRRRPHVELATGRAPDPAVGAQRGRADDGRTEVSLMSRSATHPRRRRQVDRHRRPGVTFDRPVAAAGREN